MPERQAGSWWCKIWLVCGGGAWPPMYCLPPPVVCAHPWPPAGPFGHPADLCLADGAAEPVTASLLLDHDAADRAAHGLPQLHQHLERERGREAVHSLAGNRAQPQEPDQAETQKRLPGAWAALTGS